MYLKKYNLKNKIALVSGAGKGLGRACAIALAEAGCNLVIISRTKKDLDEVSRKIKKFKVKCKTFVCDITNYNDLKNIIDDLRKGKEIKSGSYKDRLTSAPLDKNIRMFTQDEIEKISKDRKKPGLEA